MKRSRSAWFAAIMLVLVLLLATACGADRKGTLTVYAGLYEDHAIKAIEAFQKETGIKVSYVRMSSGEILARIRAEKDMPKASVWFGGPADTFVQAQSEGLLHPYISRNASMIDNIYKDPDGYWTGIYVGSIALVSNKAWLQEVGLTPPQSWEDLLNPKYKGMLSMADPRSSGTAYTVLATLVQLWGEEKAFDYLKKLHKQIRSYTTAGSIPGRSVGMGEIGTSIMFSHDAVKFYKEGFRNIMINFPSEGTGYEIGAVAVIHNGPNLPEAQTFVDWALTRHAQELGKQVGNYQLLTNREAISPEEAFPLKNLNVIPYRHDWSGQNRQRLINRWVNEVQSEK
ncbi:ABC transporter substrate-binding protein [Paenibacillus thalictri]|uniref:ABC transporter substrate-binding protein n=1 Tax=Paenibacillus thalictri TaxID=2527873 RepID=A0A4Q9DXC4_9BACL|nr:ABC transporter substrate-binding protein [Paenibacillus thalictri]TBL81774.1 ABC transporter substrate-binding protein [Paenibacillus thalictri]